MRFRKQFNCRAGGRAGAALLLAAALATPLAALCATPASSPPPSADDDQADSGSVLVVKGHRPPPQPGAVVGDIKPELQLSPADIQSFGVSTVTDLLDELAPETRSDRGRSSSTPVVLLNGRRISSFNEIENIPTEAILRVDILPEEVSLKYGYTADQRVVNIVLRRRFHAITGELEGGEATEGGDPGGQVEVDQFRVRGDSRLNLDMKVSTSEGLTYADRGLAPNASSAPYDLSGNVVSASPGGQIDPALSALAGQPVSVAGVPAGAAGGRLSLADFAPAAGVANVTDTARDRSLAPLTRQMTANAVIARPLPLGINATVNATFAANTSETLQGLPGIGLQVPAGDPFSPFSDGVVVDRYVGAAGPLRQVQQGWTFHLGSTLNRDLGDWRLSLTNAYDHGDTVTATSGGVNAAPLQALLDQDAASFDPFAALPDGLIAGLPTATARSISGAANGQVLANGPLIKLPAGALYVSAKAGDSESWQTSTSRRLDAAQAASLSRNDANAQLNIDLPLTSRTHRVFGTLGELSVNLNLAADDLSDFGVLKTLGYGVNWTPIPGYNLIVSETHDHAAPTQQQLGGPLVQTPDAPVFDYVTGQTVNVTQISGGDRQLAADDRHVLKVGLTLKPIDTENLTFTADYINSRIDNAIGAFPATSPAIEAAFPDRFIRNTDGELVEEDERPVNFAREDREELRWGLNYSRPVGKQPPPADWRAFARRSRPNDNSPGSDAGGRASSATPPDATAPSAADGDRRAHGDLPAQGAGFGGSGGGGGRGLGGANAAAGRFQIAIYHTVVFNDQIRLRPGGPVLDLLNGAAAGDTGGQPQHEIEAQLGFTENGYGVRLNADWKSGTMVKGASLGRSDDLTFSDIATVTLRLFDNLGQQPKLVRRYPILRGARLSVKVVNLFDQRIDVRSGAGTTPLVYQPDYLDPAGRTITVGFRKLFY